MAKQDATPNRPGQGPMSPLRIQSVHGDGTPHRMWLHVDPTPDPWAFSIPKGSPVVEADGGRWSSPYPVVALFWPQRFYQVLLLLKANGTEYYCNLVADVAYDPVDRVIRYTDLDLDVRKTSSGVELLDEEEFEERKASYLQPFWASEAKAAAAVLMELARADQGPFQPAIADEWRAWIQVRVRKGGR